MQNSAEETYIILMINHNQLTVKTMQSRPMDMKHEEVAMEG